MMKKCLLLLPLALLFCSCGDSHSGKDSVLNPHEKHNALSATSGLPADLEGYKLNGDLYTTFSSFQGQQVTAHNFRFRGGVVTFTGYYYDDFGRQYPDTYKGAYTYVRQKNTAKLTISYAASDIHPEREMSFDLNLTPFGDSVNTNGMLYQGGSRVPYLSQGTFTLRKR